MTSTSMSVVGRTPTARPEVGPCLQIGLGLKIDYPLIAEENKRPVENEKEKENEEPERFWRR